MSEVDGSDPKQRAMVLPRYGSNGASSRVRMLQYLPFLKEQGLCVTVQPFFSTDYLKRRYGDRRLDVLDIIRSYLGRFGSMFDSMKFDTYWIEKEMLPYLPAFIEKMLLPSSSRIVIDMDDAVFLNYANSRRQIIRTMLGGKFKELFRRADTVCAGNQFLADFARDCGANDVVLLPSVVDITKYQVRPDDGSGQLTVGWIGSPATETYLTLVAPVLRQLSATQNFRFLAIGARQLVIPGVNIETRPWSEDSEIGDIQMLDVGIMPLQDTVWEQGKCGYKLIQYMACGVPVVASAVGANNDIVSHGEDGFLVNTDEGWRAALQALLEDPSLRRVMARNGREKIERRYSLQGNLPVLSSVLLGN